MKDNNKINNELNIDQVETTNKMLQLAIAQLNTSLEEGTLSVMDLANNLATMMTKFEQLQAMIGNEDKKQNLTQHCISIAADIQKTIISIQFYDKFRQRLEHVSASLTDLSASSKPTASLLYQAQQRHTMPDEDAIFEMIMNGMAAKDIILHHVTADKEQNTDDIELF